MSKKSAKALTIEEYELCNKLKSMRFSGMAAELERVFADPNADLMAFNDKIQRIVDAEWDLRYTKKLNRFIKMQSAEPSGRRCVSERPPCGAKRPPKIA